jgi:hypothetical protein
LEVNAEELEKREVTMKRNWMVKQDMLLLDTDRSVRVWFRCFDFLFYVTKCRFLAAGRLFIFSFAAGSWMGYVLVVL